MTRTQFSDKKPSNYISHMLKATVRNFPLINEFSFTLPNFHNKINNLSLSTQYPWQMEGMDRSEGNTTIQ